MDDIIHGKDYYLLVVLTTVIRVFSIYDNAPERSLTFFVTTVLIIPKSQSLVEEINRWKIGYYTLGIKG